MHHRLCHLTRVIERDTAERSSFARDESPDVRLAPLSLSLSLPLVMQGGRRARIPRRVLISEVGTGANSSEWARGRRVENGNHRRRPPPLADVSRGPWE